MNKQFWHRNGSTILTVLGGVGVVATSVLAVKATPKAMQLIEEAKEEKGDELTKWDIVRLVGPAYLPSLAMGTATIACIFGANILNKRQQAALSRAYALLNETHRDYKHKVTELYVDDAESKIREEIAKDNYNEEEFEVADEDDGKVLYYDEYSRRYFRATPLTVKHAEYEINKMLTDGYYVYLNEFYQLLGIDETDYGNFMGWNSGAMYEMYWSSWINFRHEQFETDDGLEGYILTFTEPMPDWDE